jgi:predicted P-loop ATPase
VQAFCAALPEWDGVDRVHEMFACFGLQFADELDLEKYFHKWFLGFMNCALGRKGKYNELILGIVGPQGVGKTTFFHRLLPEPLQRYMAEVSKELLDTKDTRIALTANLLMLADEVGLLEPKQFSMMNQLTTMDRVKERMVYAKLVEEMLRRASLCVTANEPNFLRSEHGSRRWVLLMVESVATERLEAVDKMQLFAQLLSEVRAGVLSQFMTAEEVAELPDFNFRHAKFLEARLFDLLFARVPEGERGEWFAIDEIFAHLESSAAHRALDPGILSKVLEHRGIPKKMTPAGERYFVLVKDGVHRESERHWNPFNEVGVA